VVVKVPDGTISTSNCDPLEFVKENRFSRDMAQQGKRRETGLSVDQFL